MHTIELTQNQEILLVVFDLPRFYVFPVLLDKVMWAQGTRLVNACTVGEFKMF